MEWRVISGELQPIWRNSAFWLWCTLHRSSPHVTDGKMTLVRVSKFYLFARKDGITKYFKEELLHGHLGCISRGILQRTPLVGNFTLLLFSRWESKPWETVVKTWYTKLPLGQTPWKLRVSFFAPGEYSKHVNDDVNVSVPPDREGLCSWNWSAK